MVILLHSSKTMRSPRPSSSPTQPILIDKAQQLAEYVQSLSATQLSQIMHISEPLADKVRQTYQRWSAQLDQQSLAIDSFVGDIYSGLQADSLSQKQRQYAQQHLIILSGLYGFVRPLDGIMPYRLEMAYRFPTAPFDNLYSFWGDQIYSNIPQSDLIINTSSVEYSQVITKYHADKTIIAPAFLTINSVTKQPTQVVVHSKIARGAFARWLITSQTKDPHQFHQFADLGYTYAASLSSYHQPTYICQQFGGIGLSQRLK